MKTCWLNKNNNKNLIVFFAGWSFDEHPFKFLDCGGFDVLFVYDYNSFDLPDEFLQLDNYSQKYLIAWSMGVFAAWKFKALFENFDLKIAVNGTLSPVDNEFGIPVRSFELTLKHAAVGLEGKFYKNVFSTESEQEKYFKNSVERSVENRVAELEHLYAVIKSENLQEEKFYDCAIVSEFDKIIPPNNQINSHERNNVPIKCLQSGHFPFYNFVGWNEIIDICR
ncbi:MAG: DUF452 family protein [Muribaculaceae bacterium]|nr:DUF452 family protein [Muribaculaceae bacterium]